MLSPTSTSSARAIAAYVIGTVFFFYAFVQRVSPSVMTTELMSEFSVGASGIGLLSGMYFYTYASLQLPVGLLVDRYGARRLLVLSAALCALSSVGFAMSSSLWIASLFRALIGGMVAFAFVGTLAIAAEFFSRKRFAMLTGFLMTTGMIGAIAGQAPLRVLVETAGWRHSFYILAIAAALLAVGSHLIIPAATKKRAVTAENKESIAQQIKRVITNRQTILCAVSGFGFAATMLSFAGLWAVPWLTSTKGLTQVEAGRIVSWLFVGVMIGSPLLGWLSDAMGRRKPVLIAGILTCLATLLTITNSQQYHSLQMGLLFFAHGIGAGSMVVLMGLSREWNKPSHSATTLGFVNMGVVGSGAVMQPVIGALLDTTWNGELLEGARIYTTQAYAFAFQSLVGVLIVAVVCVFLLKESYCKQQVQ